MEYKPLNKEKQQNIQNKSQNLIQKQKPKGGTNNKTKLSYLTYNKLVGESDGGKELSNQEFQEVLQKYHDSWQNRLYVHFARTDIQKECVRVKPPCFCFCSHTFKSHEWYDVDKKKVGCRTPGCQCTCFKYLPRQGSWTLTCTCKHSAWDHEKSENPGKCKKCNCQCFQTTYSCQCGGKWDQHDTIVDTQLERNEQGKSVDTEVVKQRLQQKKVQGCGKCSGCKNLMPCALKKK